MAQLERLSRALQPVDPTFARDHEVLVREQVLVVRLVSRVHRDAPQLHRPVRLTRRQPLDQRRQRHLLEHLEARLLDHQAHFTRREKAQVRAVQNARLGVLPPPLAQHLEHAAEAHVRDAHDHRPVASQHAHRFPQRAHRVHQVLEHVREHDAVEEPVLIGQIDRPDVPENHRVQFRLRRGQRPLDHLDAVDFLHAPLLQGGAQFPRPTANVQQALHRGRYELSHVLAHVPVVAPGRERPLGVGPAPRLHLLPDTSQDLGHSMVVRVPLANDRRARRRNPLAGLRVIQIVVDDPEQLVVAAIDDQVSAVLEQILESVRFVCDQQRARGHGLEHPHVEVAADAGVHDDLGLGVDPGHVLGPELAYPAVGETLAHRLQQLPPPIVRIAAQAAHVGHVVHALHRAHVVQFRGTRQRQPRCVGDAGFAKRRHVRLLRQERQVEMPRHIQAQVGRDVGVDEIAHLEHPGGVEVGRDGARPGIDPEVDVGLEGTGQSGEQVTAQGVDREVDLMGRIRRVRGTESPQLEHLLGTAQPGGHDLEAFAQRTLEVPARGDRGRHVVHDNPGRRRLARGGGTPASRARVGGLFDDAPPVLGEGVDGELLGHGVAGAGAQGAGQVPVIHELANAAPQDLRMLRDEALDAVGQRRGAVGQRDDGHAAGHGLEHGQVVAVLVFLPGDVKQAPVGAVQPEQVLEGSGLFRVGDEGVEAGHPVRDALADALLEIHVEHEVAVAHHVAHAQDLGDLARVAAELVDVDARQYDLAGDAVVVAFRFRNEHEPEAVLQPTQQFLVDLVGVVRVRADGGS